MDRAEFAGWRRRLALVCAGLLPAMVAAQPWPSQTVKDSHLRAGPAVEYPVVAVLLRGTDVAVEGCLADYRWCDVAVAGYRGWVYGGNLVLGWQGQPAPVLDIGAVVGIAILGFALEDYWGQHYHAAPWYPQRHEWVRRMPPPIAHPRPPGPPRVAPPPGMSPPDVHWPRPMPPSTRPPGTRPPEGRPPEGRPPGVQAPGVQPPVPRPPGPVQPPATQPPARPRAQDGPHGQDGPRVAPAARAPETAPRQTPSPQADGERRPARPNQGKRPDSD